MTARACDEEDVGNIAFLEHVNVQVPDQQKAILFYVVGLGLTRDPYLTVGLENMWVNVGEQQFHLPTREAQVIPGHIGLVFPDLEALERRLGAVRERLAGSCFAFQRREGWIEVTCPWGNRFRCHPPGDRFGDMLLGMAYVEFSTRPGTAAAIARFYDRVLGAPAEVESDGELKLARVSVGAAQWLCFRETREPLRPYDGHHIAIYVANFSGPYSFLRERGLVTEGLRNHQFRFKSIIDPSSGEEVFQVEHEVRSLKHPMYRRPLVNRNPEQTQRSYRRGRDAIMPTGR